MPRLSDGRPDLEGVWENNSATPLERPKQFAGKPRLSDEELATLERRAKTLFGPDAEATFGDALYTTLLADARPRGLGSTGSYSQNWLPDRYFEHRTSLITIRPTAVCRRSRHRSGPDAARRVREFGRVGAKSRRCHSRIAASITASPTCLRRTWPFTGSCSHPTTSRFRWKRSTTRASSRSRPLRIMPSSMQQYLGDSRGRWEGDTLVVETTNFHPNGNPMGGYSVLSDEKLRLVERFRRTADDTLEYTFTVDNPTMWTGPGPRGSTGSAPRVSCSIRLSRGELQPARHARRRPR